MGLGAGKGKYRFGFAEELGNEFGRFESDFLLIGDFCVCSELEDRHCAVECGS